MINWLQERQKHYTGSEKSPGYRTNLKTRKYSGEYDFFLESCTYNKL